LPLEQRPKRESPHVAGKLTQPGCSGMCLFAL
jgi:hypothetical protein